MRTQAHVMHYGKVAVSPITAHRQQTLTYVVFMHGSMHPKSLHVSGMCNGKLRWRGRLAHEGQVLGRGGGRLLIKGQPLSRYELASNESTL